MTASAPSPAEQAVIDRFGIFEPEARVVEEVARAIWQADGFPGPTWEDEVEGNRADYRRLAAAAVAAYRAAQDGGAEEAVRRVGALAEEYDANLNWREWGVGSRIRAALAPQAGDGAR